MEKVLDQAQVTLRILNIYFYNLSLIRTVAYRWL